MKRLWLVMVCTVLIAACGSAEEPSGSTAVGDGPDPTEEATSSTGATTADQVESAGTAPTSEVQCVLADDGVGYELIFTNDSAQLVDYVGAIELLDGDTVVHTKDDSALYVEAGEVVRQYALGGQPPGTAVTSCQAVPASLRPVPVTLIGAGDVGPCENLREGEFGFAYELTVTNGSEGVSANYAIVVAIRDGSGERVTTRLLLAKSVDDNFADLEPGEIYTLADDTLGAPFAPGHSCAVVSVDKRTSEEFLASDGGVLQGSLDSDVGFVTGSAELTEDAAVILADTAEMLRTTHSGPVCVEGFADSVGADADNLLLSQQRADAVADYFRSTGATNEITAIGYGEQLATADEVDDPNLRRVDISFAACSP